MNPIEHVWAMISRELVGQVFVNRDSLWAALQAAFTRISRDQIIKLYDSMPRRVATLMAVRGGYICY